MFNTFRVSCFLVLLALGDAINFSMVPPKLSRALLNQISLRLYSSNSTFGDAIQANALGPPEFMPGPGKPGNEMSHIDHRPTHTSSQAPQTGEAYTTSFLSKLWHHYHIQTASLTEVVKATPVPEAELVRPKRMPKLDRREKLPKNFMWGVSSSAMQIEGAVKADGRGPSIIDMLTHEFSLFGHTADVATNHYYLYEEDAMRLASVGVRYYAMSISWPRILPFGKGQVNKKGLQHYIDEIDYLLSLGITPVVTLFHWDLPVVLQELYNGWLGEEFIDDFVNYAEIIFDALGDKVKHWVTFNEPQVMCGILALLPEAIGDLLPPLELTPLQKTYTCSRIVLLAHAKAARLWREINAKKKPKTRQPSESKSAYLYPRDLSWSKTRNFNLSYPRPTLAPPPLKNNNNNGFKKHLQYPIPTDSKIGIKNSFLYVEPLTVSPEDATAQYRYLEFAAGWFLQPLFGDGGYPQVINATIPYIPMLTKDEMDLVKGTCDYLAWDGYNGAYVKAPNDGLETCLNNTTHPLYPICAEVVFHDENGWLIGDYSDRPGLLSTPELFKNGVRWLTKEYNPQDIIISEFGMPVFKEDELPVDVARYDSTRVDYMTDYLNAILDLVAYEHVNITGAFAWAATDNWEWGNYSTRFDLQYVDYKNMQRFYKKSMLAFVDFFQNYVQV